MSRDTEYACIWGGCNGTGIDRCNRCGSPVSRPRQAPMTPPRPTAAQTRIMRRAVHSGGACFVRGAEVAAARAIVRAGCATLSDDGAIPGDGERWWFVITAAGRAALSAANGSKP